MDFFKYLFNINPGTEFKYYIPLGILVGALVAASVIVSIVYGNKKQHDFAFKRNFRKTSLKLSLFAMFFLFLLGVRYENIPYFSMRLWLLLGLLALAYFIFRVLKTYFIEYRKERLNAHHAEINTETKEVKIYLPNKKKR